MKNLRIMILTLLAFAMFLPTTSVNLAANEVVEETVSNENLQRLGGKDRYGTAVKVSKLAYKDGSDTVVLAGGFGEVDALTGTMLTHSKKAPLLLTNPDKLTPITKDEIVRLNAKKVIILGGEAVVSKAVVSELEKLEGLTVTRVFGKDRYETAVKVAKRVAIKHPATHAFLVRGYAGEGVSLADALAIGPVSANLKQPVLLVHTDSIPQYTLDALKNLGITNVTIIGGSSAVSDKVKDNLPTGVTLKERIAGSNREETAVKIAKQFFPEATAALFANGYKSADALIGGYFGALIKAPILFTSSKSNFLPEATNKYLEENKNINKGYLLGGTSVISNNVDNTIKTILETKEEEETPPVTPSPDPVADTYAVTFNVTPEGATVVVKSGEEVVAAEEDGIYKLEAGDYTYTVTAEGYDSVEDVAFTVGEEAKTVEVTLTETEVPATKYAVTFNVTPEGATVVVKSGEEVVAAEEDGTYKLEAGDYTYTVTAEGYDSVENIAFTIGEEAKTVEVTLTETVVKPTPAEAKAAFLGYLEAEVTEIEVAKVVIDGENITTTFKDDANPGDVLTAATGLINAIKDQVSKGSLTLKVGEREVGNFNLEDGDVAVQIAEYLLDGTSPTDFIAKKQTIVAAYTAAITDEFGVEFDLGGDVTFTVVKPTSEEAKADFLTYLTAEVEGINVAKVVIDGENITTTFKDDANPGDVLTAATGLINAIKDQVSKGSLTLKVGEREVGNFNLEEGNVAVQIAEYLLDGTSPTDFIAKKQTIVAAYTAAITDEFGVEFDLGGDVTFTVVKPTSEEAKADFLTYLTAEVEGINVAKVVIDGENITTTFKDDANPGDVLTAATGLINAIKDQVSKGSLTLKVGEREVGNFNLEEGNVAVQIAEYLLDGTSPTDFIAKKQTIVAAYTAAITDEFGVEFDLGGDVTFTVVKPTSEEAKADFLTYLTAEVEGINVAKVVIDGENITTTFKDDTNPGDVLTVATGLINAIKDQVSAGTLTLKVGEREAGNFNLEEGNVAVQIAEYLLDGTSPTDFIAKKQTIVAAYTAAITDEFGVEFDLGGDVTFTVVKPTEGEAKAAFLGYLEAEVTEIEVAKVVIDGENITTTFKDDADPGDVLTVATGLINAIKDQVSAGTLTLTVGEKESKDFNLEEGNVAVQIAEYLLDGTSPTDFIAKKQTIVAAYTAAITDEFGVEFDLGGDVTFTVVKPTEGEAKAAFLGYLEAEVTEIEVAKVVIDGENITTTFKDDADPGDVLTVATGLINAIKDQVSAGTLTLTVGEKESKDFNLEEGNVAVQIAEYLLDGTSPTDFIAKKQTIVAAYTAAITDEFGVEFDLGGDVTFTVVKPTEGEAKAAFLGYLEAEVTEIEVAKVVIDGENITTTFKDDTNPGDVLTVATGLINAIKDQVSAGTLTLKVGEREAGNFNLEEGNVAVQIAEYLLDGTSPTDFIAKKQTIVAAYTAAITDEYGVKFGLDGEVTFTVVKPTEGEAKAAFLGYLEAEVTEIEVAKVVIDGENITTTFKDDADPGDVLTAATSLINAIKDQVSAGTLTLTVGEKESKDFNLEEGNVAVQIAEYLLDGTSPTDFIAKKQTIVAAYTAAITDEFGVEFDLGGDVTFTVVKPTEGEAKAAFLGYLEAEVTEIEVAKVVIDGENITTTFKDDTNPGDVLTVATGLINAIKDQVSAGTLTLKVGEREAGNFNLEDTDVAVQIAEYLLDGTTPNDFIAEKQTIAAAYTAAITDEYGVEFDLGGEVTFTVVKPTPEEAKADFLAYLETAVEDIDVADVVITEEDITTTFKADANPGDVLTAATSLINAIKEEVSSGTLTLKVGEREVGNFNLEDTDVAVQIAEYLLDGTTPNDFIAEKQTIAAAYTAAITDEYGVEFDLGGEVTFTVVKPTPEEAKADFLAYLETAVEDIDVADVVITEEDITTTFKADANPGDVLTAATSLINAIKEEVSSGTLTLKVGEREVGNFNLEDTDVAVQIAEYLLDGTTPNDFIAEKQTIAAAYTAAITDEYGVEFNLGGKVTFTVVGAQ